MALNFFFFEINEEISKIHIKNKFFLLFYIFLRDLKILNNFVMDE